MSSARPQIQTSNKKTVPTCHASDVKGILRTQEDELEDTKIVTWDEPTLAAHDLERGTRMHIDEPKTPYHHPNDPELPVDALDLGGPPGADPVGSIVGFGFERRCSADNPSSEKLTRRGSGENQSVGVDPAELLKKLNEPPSPEVKKSLSNEGKQDFESKRKQHYNEYLLIKQMKENKRKNANSESDDDDE